MKTWGTFNFTGFQKVSTGTLFCQGVSNGTFSLTKKKSTLHWLQNTCDHHVVQLYNYSFTQCSNISTKPEDLSQTLTHPHNYQAQITSNKRTENIFSMPIF